MQSGVKMFLVATRNCVCNTITFERLSGRGQGYISKKRDSVSDGALWRIQIRIIILQYAESY